MNKEKYYFNDWEYQIIISFTDTKFTETIERLTVKELDEQIPNVSLRRDYESWVIRDRKGKFIKRS